MSSKRSDGWRPSKEQWVAVAAASATMTAATTPIGGAVTAAGATAGVCLSNWLRREDEDN